MLVLVAPFTIGGPESMRALLEKLQQYDRTDAELKDEDEPPQVSRA